MLPLGNDKKDRYAKLSFLGEGQVSNYCNLIGESITFQGFPLLPFSSLLFTRRGTL